MVLVQQQGEKCRVSTLCTSVAYTGRGVCPKVCVYMHVVPPPHTHTHHHHHHSLSLSRALSLSLARALPFVLSLSLSLSLARACVLSFFLSLSVRVCELLTIRYISLHLAHRHALARTVHSVIVTPHRCCSAVRGISRESNPLAALACSHHLDH